MAHERPTASHVSPHALTMVDGGIRASDAHRLTRAEASALRRSAPLTHAKVREHFELFRPSGLPRA